MNLPLLKMALIHNSISYMVVHMLSHMLISVHEYKDRAHGLGTSEQVSELPHPALCPLIARQDPTQRENIS